MDEQRIPKPIILHLCAKPDARAILLAFLTEVFCTNKSRVELLSVYKVPFKKVALPDVDEQQLTTLLTRYRVS